jgi:molybdopterin molybdotransferase
MTLSSIVDRILGDVESLETLDAPLLEAAGCAASFEVVAPTRVPPFATALYDGYCVRLEDVAGAATTEPRVIPVVGDTRPGDPPVLSVQPGFCVRITAGAALPSGTEAVVPTADTDGGIARVAVQRAPLPAAGVLPAGAHLQTGDVLVGRGDRLRAQHLGLLAAAGMDRVAVSPRPRVVVVPVGDELVEPGSGLLPGQWTDTNGTVLTAAVRDAGALAFRVPPMPADYRSLLDAVEDQLVRADLVVLVDAGGASEQAVVRDVLGALGDVSFLPSSSDPVTSIGWGRIGPDATPLLVVPHDPLGAFVAAELVVRPVVRRLLGLTPERRAIVRAVHRGRTPSTVGVERVLPALLDVEEGVYAVRPIANAGHALRGTTGANAFVIVPEDLQECEDGRTVEVVLMDRRHG